MADTQPAPPIFHNPSQVWEDIKKQKRAMRDLPPTKSAVRDKMKDLREEPDWLLAELRAWASYPDNVREATIKRVMINTHYRLETKDKCLRWILTQERERRLAIMIVNFILPALPKETGK